MEACAGQLWIRTGNPQDRRGSKDGGWCNASFSRTGIWTPEERLDVSGDFGDVVRLVCLGTGWELRHGLPY